MAGVNDDGRREIFTWRLGDSKSEKTWGEAFGELKSRGLGGVELVVSDGHEGVRVVLHRAFPQAAFNGHAETVEFLLKRGADPNVKTESGMMPLMLAVLRLSTFGTEREQRCG